MANRQNGEVSIDVNGERYTMALTLDAMVALEELFSTPTKEVTFQQVADAADKGSVKHIRAMLWAVLQLHHPDLAIKDVSPLVHRAGGVGAVVAKFLELIQAAQPDRKDLAALGVAANPPVAQGDARVNRGTGARSTSTLVGSV